MSTPNNLTNDADELKALYKNQITILQGLKVCQDHGDWLIVADMVNEQIAEALNEVDKICPPAYVETRQQDNTMPLPKSKPRNYGLDHTDLNQGD